MEMGPACGGISQQAGSSCHDLLPGEAAVDVANMLVAGAECLGLCLSRPHRTISFAAADGVGGGAEKRPARCPDRL